MGETEVPKSRMYKIWKPEKSHGWNWMPITKPLEHADYEEDVTVVLSSMELTLYWVDYPEREIVQDLILDLIVEDSDLWLKELNININNPIIIMETIKKDNHERKG